jgi:hypothetical protein
VRRSVAVAADPAIGLPAFERWREDQNADVRWIVRTWARPGSSGYCRRWHPIAKTSRGAYHLIGGGRQRIIGRLLGLAALATGVSAIVAAIAARDAKRRFVPVDAPTPTRSGSGHL